MRILSLDLGTKSLGISISDPLNLTAIPLENMFYPEKNLKFLIEEISSLIEDNQVDTILIGYPLKTDGRKSDMCEYVDLFYSLLKSRYPSLNLIKYDERFSTKRGLVFLKNKEDRKNKKDLLASYVILSDFLNSDMQ